MNKTINFNQLRQLISAGEIEEALQTLVAKANTFPQKSDRTEILHLSSRWETHRQQERMEVANHEQLNLNRQKIAFSLLQLIDRLENAPLNPPPAPTPLFKNWKSLLAGFAAVIAVLAGIAEFSGYSLRDIFSEEKTTPIKISKDTIPKKDTIISEPIPEKQPKPPPKEENKPSTPPKTKPEKPTETNTTNTPKTQKLNITCKTNKGKENLEFTEGETLELFLKANKPCRIRIIYKLADERLVLLENDRTLAEKDIDKWIPIDEGFWVEAPFGKEKLFVFAQNKPFAALKTKTTDDGYTLITEGLPDALTKTRGLKKKKVFAEDRLDIFTKPKTE